ncbi:uncharacterized protein MYCFIDRAFT_180261 [Pseudocercospora fijiensis CIRAD86]|uniref:Uncharacterized protein n=1 Tax=Pseudocercospora fijiensis (strain CIRAD86) TaxID=383855 RepID=M2ZDC6_PSEFD|nr:uncharacterized protein MYCFIDRAFT_180261 [Pseudocercospora fijiensis CIRAD86]EME77114.1 hypothetical protein MYCFIDRAFT_180261 [Pseudocercospora fijiensis CIRAD86]
MRQTIQGSSNGRSPHLPSHRPLLANITTESEAIEPPKSRADSAQHTSDTPSEDTDDEDKRCKLRKGDYGGIGPDPSHRRRGFGTEAGSNIGKKRCESRKRDIDRTGGDGNEATLMAPNDRLTAVIMMYQFFYTRHYRREAGAAASRTDGDRNAGGDARKMLSDGTKTPVLGHEGQARAQHRAESMTAGGRLASRADQDREPGSDTRKMLRHETNTTVPGRQGRTKACQRVESFDAVCGDNPTGYGVGKWTFSVVEHPISHPLGKGTRQRTEPMTSGSSVRKIITSFIFLLRNGYETGKCMLLDKDSVKSEPPCCCWYEACQRRRFASHDCRFSSGALASLQAEQALVAEIVDVTPTRLRARQRGYAHAIEKPSLACDGTAVLARSSIPSAERSHVVFLPSTLSFHGTAGFAECCASTYPDTTAYAKAHNAGNRPPWMSLGLQSFIAESRAGSDEN